MEDDVKLAVHLLDHMYAKRPQLPASGKKETGGPKLTDHAYSTNNAHCGGSEEEDQKNDEKDDDELLIRPSEHPAFQDPLLLQPPSPIKLAVLPKGPSPVQTRTQETPRPPRTAKPRVRTERPAKTATSRQQRGEKPQARAEKPQWKAEKLTLRGEKPQARGEKPHARGEKMQVRGEKPQAREKLQVRGEKPQSRREKPQAKPKPEIRKTAPKRVANSTAGKKSPPARGRVAKAKKIADKDSNAGYGPKLTRYMAAISVRNIINSSSKRRSGRSEGEADDSVATRSRTTGGKAKAAPGNTASPTPPPKRARARRRRR